MTGPGEEEPRPKLLVIGAVWAVVGVLALVVAAVATNMVVAVFGVIAIVAGAVLYGTQQARERSARETRAAMRARPPEPPPPDEGGDERV